jgi:hypothetical protein
MKITVQYSRLLSLVVCLALALSLLPLRQVQAVSPDIVVSQVYGGGGNSGGVYTNDYIELFNRGTSTVSVAGWSVVRQRHRYGHRFNDQHDHTAGRLACPGHLSFKRQPVRRDRPANP